MDNIQFWIWLIVIVVTLIARARKQSTTPRPAKPVTPSEPKEDFNRPLTFEELLKEIESAKKPTPKVTVPSYQVDKAEDEGKSLEDINYQYPGPDKSNEIYEQAKREAFNRPSLEETLKLEDTVVRFNRFRVYGESQRPLLAAGISEELRNPSGFRKAFIMSEILARRF